MTKPGYDPMWQFKNVDGTYNGIKALAAWTGLDEAEVQWFADRMQALIREGKTGDEAKQIALAEAKDKPWTWSVDHE